MEDTPNVLHSVCERLPQCATDFILACVLHGAVDLALNVLDNLNISDDDANAFVDAVRSCQQEDQRIVSNVKDQLEAEDEQMIELARAIFRVYEVKP